MFPIYCVSYTLVTFTRFRTIYAAFLTAVCVYTPVLYENKKQEKLLLSLRDATFARYSDFSPSIDKFFARYYRFFNFRWRMESAIFFLFFFLSSLSRHPPLLHRTPAVSNISHDPPFVQWIASHSLGGLITVKRVYCTAYRLAPRSQFQAALAPRFTKWNNYYNAKGKN